MQKTISILVSFLLLVSGTQLAFGQHFCDGKVVIESVMLGQKKMSCASLGADDNCAEEKEAKQADCCIDVFYEIETDSNYSVSYFEMPQVQVVGFSVITHYISRQFVVFSFGATTISEYLPPPLEKDIPVLYETFLI